MDAVKELIVNAIVHKDYSLQQEIAVYVYEDNGPSSWRRPMVLKGKGSR